MTAKQLYRGMLKYVKTYPSKNRVAIRQAIIDEVHDWKLLKEPLEVRKAVKKMRMCYAHLYMYHLKMQEVLSDGPNIDKPLGFKDLNRK